jgi:hypothetical protein
MHMADAVLQAIEMSRSVDLPPAYFEEIAGDGQDAELMEVAVNAKRRHVAAVADQGMT